MQAYAAVAWLGGGDGELAARWAGPFAVAALIGFCLLVAAVLVTPGGWPLVWLVLAETIATVGALTPSDVPVRR